MICYSLEGLLYTAQHLAQPTESSLAFFRTPQTQLIKSEFEYTHIDINARARCSLYMSKVDYYMYTRK